MVESADEVSKLLLLSQEVFRLQELYAKCAKIYRWISSDYCKKNGENLNIPESLEAIKIIMDYDKPWIFKRFIEGGANEEKIKSLRDYV
ncbi:hypothetical protein Glove_132g112 [Diversispora epigaea]|uniref:Uncharacterized protein n=1 Tax=Diversispora epigaea TaxID=1348612 RepID=A0A397J025_9GLOM|nr:hypothetical protein Glove_132g112 [Diversispora epigaea]